MAKRARRQKREKGKLIGVTLPPIVHARAEERAKTLGIRKASLLRQQLIYCNGEIPVELAKALDNIREEISVLRRAIERKGPAPVEKVEKKKQHRSRDKSLKALVIAAVGENKEITFDELVEYVRKNSGDIKVSKKQVRSAVYSQKWHIRGGKIEQ
jgi:hypothetical protein